MNKILHNPDKNEIIEAIETNTYEYRKWFSKSIKGGEIIQDEEFYLFCSGLKYGFTNFVIDIKIRENANSKIEDIVSFFKKRNLPFLCLIGPNSKPNNIEELLFENNLRLVIKEPAMAFFLDKFEVKNKPLAELEIVEPRNYDELIIWNNIRKEVYEFPEEVLTKSYLIPILDSKVTAYMAYVEKKPIATSLVFYDSGVAGIYSVTTLPEYRGKGIGTYMTYLLMQDAKNKGYKLITLHSSEKGLSVYRKLGFQEYDYINYYFWKP
ncbi:MAG: GNAT family N-acetyltransferase [Candidatus Thorarchaeota archaeon]